MMKGFDSIELEWEGKTFSVPATRQMELILRVEAGLTRDENGAQASSVLMRPSGPLIGRLTATYADALRYAGAPVTDMQVYRKAMEDARAGTGDLVSEMILTCCKILGLIGDDDQGEAPAATGGKKSEAAAD